MFRGQGSAPIGGQQVGACLAVWGVVVTKPPVLSRVVVRQDPHQVAVVVDIHHVRLVNGCYSVLAVAQRMVHIPARNEGRHGTSVSSMHPKEYGTAFTAPQFKRDVLLRSKM